MIVLDARNVNDALSQGLKLIHERGVEEPSRNGPVWRVPEPVATVYQRPAECVLFSPQRDANPFFHCLEAFWLLAGRDTLKDMTLYVARMAEFSDDGGITQPGSYGKRWRSKLGADQLSWAVNRLRVDPSDRRCVIAMWDARQDMKSVDRGGKDVPCNLSVMPWINSGKLHITVTCRSNDILLGAYGANAVHFAILQCYLAGRLGLQVGTYTQVSINYHMYQSSTVPTSSWTDPYISAEVTPMDLFTDFGVNDNFSDEKRERVILEDLNMFFDQGAFTVSEKLRWPFLRRVVVPMALAHQHLKSKKGEVKFAEAAEILGQVQATDWQRAALEWVARRHQEWRAKNVKEASIT